MRKGITDPYDMSQYTDRDLEKLAYACAILEQSDLHDEVV